MCREERDGLYSHAMGPKGKRLQLDCILGPKTNKCDTYICNQEKMCSTWDHYGVHVVAQDDEEESCTVKKFKKWTGWRPQDGEQEEKFKKMVLQNGDKRKNTREQAKEARAEHSVRCSPMLWKKRSSTPSDVNPPPSQKLVTPCPSPQLSLNLFYF